VVQLDVQALEEQADLVEQLLAQLQGKVQFII
jgi:hypothetical protein